MLPLNQMNIKLVMLIQILNIALSYYKDRNAYCTGMVHSKSGSAVTLNRSMFSNCCRPTNYKTSPFDSRQYYRFYLTFAPVETSTKGEY